MTAPQKPVRPAAPSIEEQEEVAEAKAEQEDLLADLPALRDPLKLRIRHTNRLIRIVAEVQPFLKNKKDEDGEDTDEAELVVDETVDMNSPEFGAMMRLVEQMDDFAESIAYDKAAYEAWSEGKRIKHFMAIMTRYQVALGK